MPSPTMYIHYYHDESQSGSHLAEWKSGAQLRMLIGYRGLGTIFPIKRIAELSLSASVLPFAMNTDLCASHAHILWEYVWPDAQQVYAC